MSDIDFTDPANLLIRIKAKDDPRTFYCARAAIKSMALNSVGKDDIVHLDVKGDDLILFLHAMHNCGGIWRTVELITTEQKMAMIRVTKQCGVKLGDGAFEGFAVFSDAIFESFTKDPVIRWGAWSNVAKRHHLNIQLEDDAIELLSLINEAIDEEKRLASEEDDTKPSWSVNDGPWKPPTHVVEPSGLTLDAMAAVSQDLDVFEDPEVAKQAWFIWTNVAERHGLDLRKDEDAAKLFEHIEEVKLEAKALQNQLKYDTTSLAALRKRFMAVK